MTSESLGTLGMYYNTKQRSECLFIYLFIFVYWGRVLYYDRTVIGNEWGEKDGEGLENDLVLDSSPDPPGLCNDTLALKFRVFINDLLTVIHRRLQCAPVTGIQTHCTVVSQVKNGNTLH